MTRKKWEDKFATKENLRFWALNLQKLKERVEYLEKKMGLNGGEKK